MKKFFLFVIGSALLFLPCFSLSSPPSDNLVYKYWHNEHDHVMVSRAQDFGWYVWRIDDEIFTIKMNPEYALSGTQEVHVYYQPKGYTSQVMDRYYKNKGSVYKVTHDFNVPLEIPENRSDWTAYQKTIQDYYNYWVKGKGPLQEISD